MTVSKVTATYRFSGRRASKTGSPVGTPLSPRVKTSSQTVLLLLAETTPQPYFFPPSSKLRRLCLVSVAAAASRGSQWVTWRHTEPGNGGRQHSRASWVKSSCSCDKTVRLTSETEVSNVWTPFKILIKWSINKLQVMFACSPRVSVGSGAPASSQGGAGWVNWKL